MSKGPPRLVIVQPEPAAPSETFLRAHAEHLPGCVAVVCGASPGIDGRPVFSQALPARAWRKALRLVRGQTWEAERTAAYLALFRRLRPDAVLAEYGGAAAAVTDACRIFGVPLVAHFHGYDASRRDYVAHMAAAYRAMFAVAAAVVAVSRPMRRRLIALGAPAEKVHCNPCGIDCGAFAGADPAAAPPVFLAVGRFVPKKAPQLTLRAFAQARRDCPAARLRMIGDGPLRPACERLAGELGVTSAVDFLGLLPPAAVQEEMRHSRAFVQHSLEAPDGDAEGTPVAILEAGASGLPVVATRHAGIPDAVRANRTGLLVAEGDVDGMAACLLRLAREPALAADLGRAARAWVRAEFAMEQRIGRLWEIIAATVHGGRGQRPAVGAAPARAMTGGRA
jgi:glycosyltransferase involved in cell wall biosynthesis